MKYGRVISKFIPDPVTGEQGAVAARPIVTQTPGWYKVRLYSNSPDPRDHSRGDSDPNAIVVEVFAEQAAFDALEADPDHGPDSILFVEDL